MKCDGARAASRNLALAALLTSLLAPCAGLSQPQEGLGQPGVSGGSAGSQGQPDTDAFYLQQAERARKKGMRTQTYIGALLDLGMHYNRGDQFARASQILTQALQLVDSGVLKPSSKEARQDRPPQVETQENGTVSTTSINPLRPYEELMDNLLPALIEAQIGASQYAPAESTIKRLIASTGSNEVSHKLNLEFAYSRYATVLRKLNRLAEANQYQRKADEIHNSFRPL